MIRTCLLLLCGVLLLARGAQAADLNAWVDDLADPLKRAPAISSILKEGAAAEAELKKLEANKKLNAEQEAIIKRLIGNILIASSPLKPLDMTKLAPIGFNAETHEKGDPRILIDPDPDTRVKNRAVVLSGEFALEQGALEYLVVSKGRNAKLHETVLCVDAPPLDIFTALNACNYDFATFQEEGDATVPVNASVAMSVEFEWEAPNDQTGAVTAAASMQANGASRQGAPTKTLVRVPLQFFAYNLQTEKTMRCIPFAFTGSVPVKNANTGVQSIAAQSAKSIAAVRFDPIALLNSPLNTRNINPLNTDGYTINWHIIPPVGTKCKLILEPYSGPELTAKDLSDTKPK